MRAPTFLSLPLKPWSLSAGIHLVFFAALLLFGRARTVDLSLINLDLSPISSLQAQVRQPEDEEWQKPMMRKRVLPPQVPLPKPQPAVVSGNGNGYRSIAQVSQLPRFKSETKAQYPDAAKRANIEGVVILQVDIDATGAVKMVQLVQGLGYGCDEAALQAVQNSTFTPAYAGDQPVPVRIRLPYRFKFEY